MCRGYHGHPVLSLFLIVFCDCDFVLGAQVISVHAEPLQRIRVKSQDFSMNTIFLIQFILSYLSTLVDMYHQRTLLS